MGVRYPDEGCDVKQGRVRSGQDVVVRTRDGQGHTRRHQLTAAVLPEPAAGVRLASGKGRWDRLVLRVRGVFVLGCPVVSHRCMLLMTVVRRRGLSSNDGDGRGDTHRVAHGSQCRSPTEENHQHERRRPRHPTHRSSISRLEHLDWNLQRKSAP